MQTYHVTPDTSKKLRRVLLNVVITSGLLLRKISGGHKETEIFKPDSEY